MIDVPETTSVGRISFSEKKLKICFYCDHFDAKTRVCVMLCKHLYSDQCEDYQSKGATLMTFTGHVKLR